MVFLSLVQLLLMCQYPSSHHVFCKALYTAPIYFVLLILGGANLMMPHAAVLVSAQQSVTDWVYGGCNPATFNRSDSFDDNFKVVEASLIQNSSKTLYHTATSESGSSSNYVYGIYQCRGDISLSDCHTCVNNAFSGILQACNSLPRGARAQYKGCFIRYESYTFFTGYEKDGVQSLIQPQCSKSNEDDPVYQQSVATALNDSAVAAPRHAVFGYNASSIGNGSHAAFALTQCMGYLSPSQCETCLAQVSNYSNECNEAVSGEVYFNSCYYLYGNTSFLFTYNDSSGTGLIPASAPHSFSANSQQGSSIASPMQGALSFAFDDRLPHELPTTKFSLKELQEATEDFHPRNKLGEGGFGPVYQGRLKSGGEVAIKMLSAQSHQGNTQFLNEVNLITTVQHRNLVRLLGYCVNDSKPLLVYEYLPKRSLDLHLFDVNENDALTWRTRFEIIEGIARGLKYLHEDSHVRIVHRDIKASNILLNDNMNPKIADFGLARFFADDRTHITTRVMGTLGYLAPEYVISGQLTDKADVYSFGLVALEIVSGRRALEHNLEEPKQNLLEWVWTLYEQKRQVQIVDERLQEGVGMLKKDVNVGEVVRVVHVALLCTQSHPHLRPSMSRVHNMLGSQSDILDLPTTPITFGLKHAAFMGL